MEKELKDLTKEELLNPAFIPSIFEEYSDSNERDEIVQQLKDRSRELKIYTKFNTLLQRYQNELRIVNNNIQAILVMNQQGLPEVTTENYITVMEQDENIANSFYYDCFTRQIMNANGEIWTDVDDSCLRVYVEKTYGIYNQQKYYDAFNNVAAKNKKHPIKNIIEEKTWDGKKRIDKFLVDICGCPDNDYSREVSRMIFYGGISRLYNPGCKFDYMPIFISKQGSGKSTIVTWLALKEEYFKEIMTIEGKDAMEALDGAWICEMSELTAMVKSKEVEAMKAFVSRTSDKYRKSYDKRSSSNPRHCIFIGTTNDHQFLTDKTGNRRYLPIELNINSNDLYDKKESVKKYILECWREALHLYNNDNIYLSIPVNYRNVLETHQEQATMDDPSVGLICDYLDKQPVGTKISGIEIFTKCLNGLRKNYKRSEMIEISRIMGNLNDWVKCERFYTDGFGQQRGWQKTDKEKVVEQKKIKVDIKWDDLD